MIFIAASVFTKRVKIYFHRVYTAFIWLAVWHFVYIIKKNGLHYKNSVGIVDFKSQMRPKYRIRSNINYVK